MSAFTEEQLKDLETLYGLKPITQSLEIKDGTVFDGMYCWWRGENGPEYIQIKLNDVNWLNAKNFPKAYSIARPIIRYVD